MRSRFFPWLSVISDEKGREDNASVRNQLAKIIRQIRAERAKTNQIMVELSCY